MDKWSLQVKDVLSRGSFACAVLVAGEGGLEREIKWTHILEQPDIDAFINGGELILTTGSGLKFDHEEGIVHLDKMIDKHAAGVCIELGTHLDSIAPEIIDYANQHDFPIIVFEEIVKFVDITQDLHTEIINFHHKKLAELYRLSDLFNKYSLMPNGILKILKEIYLHLNAPIFFISELSKSYYYPPKKNCHQSTINDLMEKVGDNKGYISHEIDGKYYTFFPVKGLGNVWGYLCLQIGNEAMDDFSFSLLDRATLAITQIMLRNQTIEERKQNQEEEIVKNMVSNSEITDGYIYKFLPPPATNLYYRLFLIDTSENTVDRTESWEEIKLQQAIIVRTQFKKYGFFPALAVDKNEIVVIAAFYSQWDMSKINGRFMDIIHELKRVKQPQIFEGATCKFGFSSIHQDYQQASSSFLEAKDVLFVQKHRLVETCFFENIGIYRLLMELYKSNKLKQFVRDYLWDIIEYDKKTKSDLLLTLSMYLKCMGSKQETAKQLFIVRQTLYHRLEKIEELLKMDLMNPVNRQAIEVALSAYELIKHDLDPAKDDLITNQKSSS
mgnify:CR=1 FL=1